MKRFALFALFVLMITGLTACHGYDVDAGHEIVLVRQPWFFGHGGVEPTPVKTGQTWTAWSTKGIDCNTQPQQFDEGFDDLMSSDGVPLDFHSIIRLKITNCVDMITRFGPDWYKNNVQSEYQNRVRQAVRKHGMNETAIKSEAIDAIDKEVSEAMVSYIKDSTLPAEMIQVTVGKANPPDAVKSQRIRTAEEQQRALTEDQRKMAEDQRKMAEESRAAADDAYLNKMGLSGEQFVRLETIKMQHEVCAKGGCTFIVGTGTPVINTAK